MFDRRFIAGVLGGVVAVGLVLSGQAMAAFTAADAAKVDAEVKVMTWYEALVAGMNPPRKVAAMLPVNVAAPETAILPTS